MKAQAVSGDTGESRAFLSTLPPGPVQRRLALAVTLVSVAIFALVVPFARTPLPQAVAFIPSYQSALAINDLVTATLLFAQFSIFRARGLLALASGYLFTAAMAVIHALTFPGLFSPTGLLGAGPQTTAWLYMFWHGGFPLFVIWYAWRNGHGAAMGDVRPPSRGAIAGCVAFVAAAAGLLTAAATAGHGALPAIMQGNGYTPTMTAVVGFVCVTSLAALVSLWMRRRHSVLDLWLMVVMVAWTFDVALSAVLNAGRFDLGFYAGRLYGLCAASFVLLVLLFEISALYARLARTAEAERKLAAAEVSRANATLEAVVASSPLPIFSVDGDRKIATWNRAAERTFGRALEDVIGRPSPLDQGDAEEAARVHQRAAAGEHLKDINLRHRRADGNELDIVLSAAPLREGDGRIAGAVYVAEDVTERRKLERQLIQAQKLEVVGQLTGGIAHDFNNMLTVIVGNAEVLAATAKPRTDAGLASAAILAAASRSADLTRQLLAFARRQALQPRRLNLNELVKNAATLLERTISADIRVEVRLGENLWDATVDPTQLESSMLNLALNARDAMPDGGLISIETGNVRLDDDYASGHDDVRAGDYAMLAISDSGTGMSREVMQRAFEPFFTTKEVGKGTGLGLSMVFGFVKQSGGHIKLYSEVGHGTTVKIYLPRAIDAGAAAADTERRDGAPARGHETILLVEDDPLVREHVKGQIERLGYKVFVAEDGPQAIKLMSAGTVRFDLLLTDVVMPGGMGGRDVAAQARRIQPGVKVLYMSGYTQNSIVHHGRLDADVHLLSKPFRLHDLAVKIREVIDEPGSRVVLDRIA